MTDHAMPVSVTVDGDVFAAHPDYVALVVLAEGIGNGPSDDASSTVLDAAEQHLLARTLTTTGAYGIGVPPRASDDDLDE